MPGQPVITPSVASHADRATASAAARSPDVPLSVVVQDPDRLVKHEVRMQIVRARLRGDSARVALEAVGIAPTASARRWANRLAKRANATGTVADRRWGRKPEKRVMTVPLQQRILLMWNGRKGANVRAIWRLIRDEVREARAEAEAEGRSVDGLVEPSYEAVYKYLNSLPEALRTARTSGLATWDKQGRPFVDYEPADYANDVAQIDHTRLDIYIRVEVAPGVWEARVVWLTLVLDVYSRAVLGYVVSTKVPDAWTTALALRHAILPKDDPAWPMRGVMNTLTPDHGKDFMAGDTARLARGLGIRLDPTPPYYPNMKAEIERLFGTIHSYLSVCVGYMPADGRSAGAAAKRVPFLLTLPQLRDEIARAFRDYHARAHRGIGGDTPVERWRATARIALPPSEEDLNVLLLKDDTVRTVTKEGIQFTARTRVLAPAPTGVATSNGDRGGAGEGAGEDVDGGRELVEVRGGRYWAPELMDHWKQQVRVRYNPEDLDSVLLYDADTGAFVCEAWLMGFAHSKYGPVEVTGLRAGYRRGLKERTTAYAKEVERADRRSARAHDEAAALARTMAEAESASRDADDDGAGSGVRVCAPAGSAGAARRARGRSTEDPRPRNPQHRGPTRPEPESADAEVLDLLALMEAKSRGAA